LAPPTVTALPPFPAVLTAPALPALLGFIPPPPDVEPATPADVPALPVSEGPSSVLEQARPALSASRPASDIFRDFFNARLIAAENNEALVLSITTWMSPGLARNIRMYLHRQLEARGDRPHADEPFTI
jgi:hypothetical protein